MAQYKVQTSNTSNVWDSKKRYKVNSVVGYNGALYQNTTGKNSTPDTLVDWIEIKTIEKLITNLSVSGTYNIDYSAGDVWRLTFVGPTTLTESNVPTTGKTKTITINGNGNFPISYPAAFTGFITGSYTGSATLNTITVQTLGTDRKVQIVQPT